ncbi:MAG: copper resistance protein NlpE [Prevotellaceae bacterium]|nr:copper resistance protein NlpE [Prevotellaceae bacterium]
MRKIVYAASIIAVVLGTVACKPKSGSQTQEIQAIDTAHNSRNSVNWEGAYKGIIPCADCNGIFVQLTLNEDETYQLIYQYVGKKDAPSIYSGKFKWDDTGANITLDIKDLPAHYKVGENKLFQLDMEGNRITGKLADKYELTKNYAE